MLLAGRFPTQRPEFRFYISYTIFSSQTSGHIIYDIFSHNSLTAHPLYAIIALSRGKTTIARNLVGSLGTQTRAMPPQKVRHIGEDLKNFLKNFSKTP